MPRPAARLKHEPTPDNVRLMFDPDQYCLLDFGRGRKLERFGSVVLDRPAPAAASAVPSSPDLWRQADAVFQKHNDGAGRWDRRGDGADSWTVAHGALRFELHLGASGNVGLFVEQAGNWDWIANRVRRAVRALRVLNLFGYTGGSSLAAASAGAAVTHVDAARPSIQRARRNAGLSGLADAPIRWIEDDARKFVDRELRRGNSYDAVILDPPSYGHGPKGHRWKIQRDLQPLLDGCAQLTGSRPEFVLLTCHTPGFGPAELEAALASAFFGHCSSGAAARSLGITSADGRSLPAGVSARWP